MKRLIATALVSLAAVTALAQKGPMDELGFHPEKLYDFSKTDSVSLFNGNLLLTIPIGIRYSVSSSLSYQFTLVFNSKVFDEETWCDTRFDTTNPFCTGINLRKTVHPNLRSNAGNGWRLSLGRLLAPVDTGLEQDSLDDPSWVYEGPAGEEHALTLPWTNSTFTGNTLAGLRMQVIDNVTRDVQFGPGEVHRFILQHSVWRLSQMRDRFGNHVDVTYTYLSNDPTSEDYPREATWSITDSVGRQHTVSFQNWPSMNDGWSRGQQVSQVDLQAYNSQRALYSFTYNPTNAPVASTPNLTSVTQPDGTQYAFSGTVDKITYPTGGTVSYTYGSYSLPGQTSLCSIPINVPAVTSRTVSDGVTTRVWNYVQGFGPLVPVTTNITDPCNLGDSTLYGPIYWSRTSVVAPLDANNHRARTDNYFSVFADGVDYNMGFTVTTKLPGQDVQKYGHSGTIGAPPPALRKTSSLQADADASDDPTHPDQLRLLATETYADCDSAGDCTNGTLLQSTYDRYTGDVLPAPEPPGSGRAVDTARLISSRTVHNDDAHCGTGSELCYEQVTYSDDNGAGQFRTTTTHSNFPSTKDATTTVQYPQWTSTALMDFNRPWLLGTYTEKTRTEGALAARETFCFDQTTGALLRRRALAGSAPGAQDILQVFSYDAAGNVQFSSDYGADVQTLDTGSDLCSIPLPSQPWYKVENTYTAGILSTSRYYDRTSGVALGFLSFDRTIDPSSGAVTAARDAAGVKTSFSYDAVPVRLNSVTSPAGAVTTYTYTNAIGSAGGTFTPAKVDASTLANSATVGAQWVFDGLGRVVRSSAQGPAAWSATETTYDEQGRVATKSEPESTGNGPPPGSLTAAYKTRYSYDALGRTKSVVAPDGSTSTVDYVGTRLKTRTSSIWTGVNRSVPVVEEYDGFGRLISVTEKSGPTSSASVVGGDIVTAYTYDVGGRLNSVKMGAATGSGGNRAFTGVTQTRLFDYDGRGFLRWESQPESGMTSYTYDARGHVTSKTQSAANSLFDLSYTYDAAERVTRLDGRNPFYPADPTQPQFRAVKELTYGADNGTFDRSDTEKGLIDLKRGKLVSATRHNYGETTAEAVYDVEDVYHYLDPAGHKTDRTTTIRKTQYGATNVVQAVTMRMSYNALDLPSTITYPMCDGCGAPPTEPDRSGMTRTYSAGRLTALSNYATSISYWPNGLRNVLAHANGIEDTQTVTDMARPSEIGFATATHPYDRCVRPEFVAQPASTPALAGSATLSVTVSGTGPFTYEWFDMSHLPDPFATHALVSSTTDSVTVTNVTATTTYNVRVSNPCGYETSESAKVTVNECAAPTTGSIKAVAQPDGSWILKPDPVARQPRTYTWLRLSDNATVGTAETLAIGVLSTTTRYRLTITDACGSGSGEISINVPLPITAGLLATASTSLTQVALTWPAIGGASQYTIERRSLGGGWEWAGTSTTNSFTDGTVAASRTYVYRVTSDNGGHTDYDVATTTAFVQAVPRTLVTTAPMNSMLDAVNSVRAAAGWPAVTWTNILAASDPIPEPSAIITARQVMACRERINEALQALGVTVHDYTDPDLLHQPIKADYVNEVERRAQ